MQPNASILVALAAEDEWSIGRAMREALEHATCRGHRSGGIDVPRSRGIPFIFVSAPCGTKATVPPPTDTTPSPIGTKTLNGEREWMFRELAKAALDPASTYEPQPQLSRREFEVIRLLVGGHRVKSVAEKLSLSPFTVRKYLGSVFPKLGVHSQEGLLLALYNTANGARRTPAK